MSHDNRYFFVANVRYDDNDDFGAHTTYRLAPAVIIPGSDTKLKATYGTAFKAPTLSQLFVSFPDFFFFANPNLRPETAVGWDAGFEQPLFNDRFRFGATYFHNDITDLINTERLAPDFTHYVNVGQVVTKGVEAFASAVITPRLRVRGDYTYTQATDETTGEELLRRPRNKASLQVAWNPIDPLTLSGTVLYVGSWIDANRNFTIPRLTAPGYTVVNIAASYMVTNTVTAFARIDNLFDKRYENPTGFERPGFGAYAGIRVANR